MFDKVCNVIAGLALLWLIQKNHQEIKTIQESTDGGNRNMAFVFVCKKIPPQGQANWVNWMKEKGNCELAQGGKYER